jgi:hypothetical protein
MQTSRYFLFTSYWCASHHDEPTDFAEDIFSNCTVYKWWVACACLVSRKRKVRWHKSCVDDKSRYDVDNRRNNNMYYIKYYSFPLIQNCIFFRDLPSCQLTYWFVCEHHHRTALNALNYQILIKGTTSFESFNCKTVRRNNSDDFASSRLRPGLFC